jgi:hypothetical protein
MPHVDEPLSLERSKTLVEIVAVRVIFVRVAYKDALSRLLALGRLLVLGMFL